MARHGTMLLTWLVEAYSWARNRSAEAVAHRNMTAYADGILDMGRLSCQATEVQIVILQCRGLAPDVSERGTGQIHLN